MRRRSLSLRGLLVIGLLTLAAGVLGLSLPPTATAQAEPTLTISPSSGPCDAAVEVKGSGFEPSGTSSGVTERVSLYLLQPGTADVSMGFLTFAFANQDGRFDEWFSLREHGCQAAALDAEAEQSSGDLLIAASGVSGFDPTVGVEQRITNIITVARYAYTTTEAMEAEPIMILTPPSGPCDAPVRVRGSGFRPPPELSPDVDLYLLQPGTADVNMDILNPAHIERDGTFTEWVGLWKYGCEAAALDSEAEAASGHLDIAAAYRAPSAPLPLQPGETIPSVVAVAHYPYTTTAVHVRTEALEVSPASGPCDGTVEVTGTGFDPGMEVDLRLALVGGEPGPNLTSAVSDDAGQFAVTFSLGEQGCRMAESTELYGDPARPQLGIEALEAAPPEPVPPGIPPILASAGYTFTTTTPGAAGVPSELPATGSGPQEDSGRELVAAIALGLAGIGFLAAGGYVYGRLRRG